MNPFTFTSTTQTNPASDKYTGNDITFTLTPFTITPDYCDISYACDSITFENGATSSITCSDLIPAGGLFGLAGAGGSLTYSIDTTKYLSENYPPGTYTVTVEGTGDHSDPPQARTATFTFTLVDPCNPPDSVTAGAALENQ